MLFLDMSIQDIAYNPPCWLGGRAFGFMFQNIFPNQSIVFKTKSGSYCGKIKLQINMLYLS